ncbi:hypothetical protein [Kribbella speibonae]|uniref:Uncharacterized protein n=1 Tax=Kribbella speibonae TaxID=1572660 RepID=A0ABY2A7N6_9ACTN|nr:hypothetical protein [Kribbella speibonae]TCC25097.1 hypothetical protein E0H58_13015 [Kribbella speibonae]
MDQPVLDAARAALVELCESGSPVLRPETIDQTLAVAVRRWQSFSRRNDRTPDLDTRTHDLAKGLLNAFEADSTLAGPLKADYQHLAKTLANVFSTA